MKTLLTAVKIQDPIIKSRRQLCLILSSFSCVYGWTTCKNINYIIFRTETIYNSFSNFPQTHTFNAKSTACKIGTCTSCQSRQKLWCTIAIVWQIWFAMVWCIWIVNIIFGQFVLNVHHFVQHTTLCSITDHMLSQSAPASSWLFPQFLVSASTCAYPQPILQTVEPINYFLYRLRLSITKTVNYSSTARLNNLPTWLQKIFQYPTETMHHIK